MVLLLLSKLFNLPLLALDLGFGLCDFFWLGLAEEMSEEMSNFFVLLLLLVI